MDKETVFLINVLKNFIWDEPIEYVKDLNWGRVLELANIHAVMGILGHVVMSNPCEETEAIAPLLRQQCFSSVALYGERAAMMQTLVEDMNEAGIDHLLFKGYIVREYYPIPELRTFGDIDFLVHLEDRKRIHEFMLKRGFEVKTDWEPVYSYLKDREYYEIHTDVMEVDVSNKADYKAYFKHVWDHTIQTGEHTWELTPEYHLLYLLTHIAKHIRGSGAGIRMYLDIAVFLKHFENRLDWDYIQGELVKLCFDDFANMVFTMVERYFGVKCPLALHDIEEQVLEDFVMYTMEAGVFGHSGRESGVVTLKKENVDDKLLSRLNMIRKRLFPSVKTIEKRYTYLQSMPILLPVAWVHRFIITLGSLEEHTQEAQQIISADMSEVLRLQRIYKEIGL